MGAASSTPGYEGGTPVKQTLIMGALSLALAGAAVSAHAGCVDPRQTTGANVHMLSRGMLSHMTARSGLHRRGGAEAQNIVGTWVATYTTGGSPGGQAIIQWHSDGTEWENINFPVLGGNLCLGSWVVVPPKQAARTHMGWLYNAGILSGYFTETETDHLTGPDAYEGTNDLKIYDLAGNLQVELPGSVTAVRFGP
jgi:hypothetical protein